MRNVPLFCIIFVLTLIRMANAGLVLESNPLLAGEVSVGEYTVSVSTDGVDPESEVWIALLEYKPVLPYQDPYVPDIGKSLNYLHSGWEMRAEGFAGDVYYWFLSYKHHPGNPTIPSAGKVIELALQFPFPGPERCVGILIADDSDYTVAEYQFTVIPEPTTLFLLAMGALVIQQKRVISG